jgi:hypothetical protein
MGTFKMNYLILIGCLFINAFAFAGTTYNSDGSFSQSTYDPYTQSTTTYNSDGSWSTSSR